MGGPAEKRARALPAAALPYGLFNFSAFASELASCEMKKPLALLCEGLCFSAVWTGLEPATPCVTGRYSNQLNYQTNCLTKFGANNS